MLMARQPPESESRHTALPPRIQLPDFRSFLSAAGQSDHPSPNQPPHPSGTDPADYAQRRPSVFENNGIPTTLTYQPHQQLQSLPPRHPHLTADYRAPPTSRELHQLPAANGHPYPYSSSDPLATTVHGSHMGYSDMRSPSHTHVPENLRARVVVGEEIVEGKGLCYIYSDNSHCPKSINGDVVNPKWGTTKAGKPRKRLGQACNTCREKKIRCDPQAPKCAQCQKFGRECKFEQSARGSQRSTRGSPTGNSSPNPDRRGSIHHDRNGSDTSTEKFGLPRAARSSISVEHLLSPVSVHSPASQESPPVKRRKYSNSPHTEPGDATTPRSLQEPRVFAVDVDPFWVDSELTQLYLGEFFAHFNGRLYQIFPKHKFLTWATSNQPKTLQDTLLLYSMLAFGTVFSHIKERAQHRKKFVAIVEAGFHQTASSPTLQTAQALLLMTMMHFSRSEAKEARECCAILMKTVVDLGLNREPSSAIEACYGLDQTTFYECRRRTFWVAYITESTLQYCIAPDVRMTSIDCELQVPCENDVFEYGTVPRLPVAIFRGSQPHDVPLTHSSSSMAKILAGTAMLRETVSWIQGLKSIYSMEQVQTSHMNFQDAMNRRLEQWKKDVAGPTVKKGDGENEAEQRPSEFLLLHCFIKMLLHRHIWLKCMSQQQIEMNCRTARGYAYELLDLLHRLAEASQHEEGTFLIACPITGFATFVAIDIITAAGFMSSVMEVSADNHSMSHAERMETGSHQSLMELMQTGMELLINLGHYWELAREHGEKVKSRFRMVMAVRIGPPSHKVAYFVRDSLYSPFGEDQDVVYGLKGVPLFRALDEDNRVTCDEDLHEIKGPQFPQ